MHNLIKLLAYQVNPILYNLMSERFRSAFRRLLNKNKYIDEFRSIRSFKLQKIQKLFLIQQINLGNSAGQPSSKTTGGHIIRQQTLINKQISFEEQTVLDAETCPMKFLNEKKVDSEVCSLQNLQQQNETRCVGRQKPARSFNVSNITTF